MDKNAVFKNLLFDLDGTLTQHKSPLGEENRAVLEALARKYRPLMVGAGAGSRRAIGITTFSGMLLATIIGITFIPALYALFQRFREWVKHGKNC